ncbi:RNA polymerase sigma factor [Microlunatus parietis]|uniref:RNA polymerase sigma-70 factor (ECF subfamily) n=1 Tax=Microlunatus parietis TaxID=682979 RepID=A0A7Y9IAC0_9ACTN|nr:RNA polymerase sigma factor [Microlunatus parietis]NYE73160.1 RNA polymerase sigma-70 factor (ECF subfamily) [Microlunatus parietis]
MIVPAETRQAFERLYDDHRQGVWALFLGRHGDRTVAEELTQETFLRLWRRIDAVAPLGPDSQRGWIFRVARNLSIDAYRTAAAARTAVRQVADDLRPRAAGDEAATDVAEVAIDRERLAAVDRAISTLPETQRVVLSMIAVGGLRAVDVAEALELPAGTVRYRLSEARRTLRMILESELERTHG